MLPAISGTFSDTNKPTRHPPSRRLPALDGLRAVAVLVVFGDHAYPDKFLGGNIGVDIFFVLSGFVITRLLLQNRAVQGRWRLARFYRDRFIRLTPALWAMVFCVGLTLPFLGRSKDIALIPLTLLYSMDYFQIVHPSSGIVFLHTWSLAVEEQFYLVWPLLLAVVSYRSHSVRRIKILALCGAFCSVVVAAILTWTHDPGLVASRIYNGPDTRAVQLLLGAALACLSSDTIPKVVHRIAGPVGSLSALGLLAWVFLMPNDAAASHLFLVLPLIGAATASMVFLLAHQESHLLTRFLAHPALSWPGRHLSYSFYLWHYPMVLIVEPVLPGPLVVRVLVTLALSCCCSMASYLAVEKPVAKRFSRKPQPLLC